MNYKAYFKGKKITVMGLGLLGRGIGDTKFLAELGADIIVTDLKTREELAPALKELESYDISYELGGHNIKHFEDRDLILKAAGVPLDSPYIDHARKHNIPVVMSASLFARLSGIPIIGVTGTRGKSTVTHLIHHILTVAGKHAFLGGNIVGVANLPFLEEVQEDSIAVFELDSWQLQGFDEIDTSPHISVFTNFLPDHMNYYKDDMQAYFFDKANIFKYQKKEDVLITTQQAAEAIEKYFPNKIAAKHIIVRPLTTTNPNLLGEHNGENIACAAAVAEALGIPPDVTDTAVQSFAGIDGRLQLLREINGIKIYNDNNATSPEATIVALRALEKNIILIMGGSDKGLSMHNLLEEIPKYCKKIVLLGGTGTELIKDELLKLSLEVVEKEKLSECIEVAMKGASSGDTVLFSPAFASFSKYFRNEYDRNDQFVKIVKNIS